MSNEPSKPAQTYGDPILGEPPTQSAFGGLVGISQQAVSALLRRGVLRPGETGAEWLKAYCQHLEREAAVADNPAHPLTIARAELASIRIEQVSAVLAAKACKVAQPALIRALIELCLQISREELARLPSDIAGALPGLPAEAQKVIADAVSHVDALLDSGPVLFDRMLRGDLDPDGDHG